MRILSKGFNFLTGVALVALFSLAFTRAYVRIQTTLIGYELGELKKQESGLLEQRSQLQMELAKLTTKNHLTMLANDSKKAVSLGAYAAQ